MVICQHSGNLSDNKQPLGYRKELKMAENKENNENLYKNAENTRNTDNVNTAENK